MAYFSVDRIEGRVAVVIGDDGSTHDVPIHRLPRGLHEGTVLVVEQGPHGAPVWRSARVDREEEARRHSRAQRTAEELRRKDPGGDIAL